MWAEQLPYGINELEILTNTKQSQFRCCVKGCHHLLKPPKRTPKFAGDVCPDHGIRVHTGGTYTYADYRRNLIVDAEWFNSNIRNHEFKYETHRFGQERSEDALTWNVFRSLQQLGLLHKVANLCTGLDCDEEPRLLLWGLHLGEKPVAWDLLIKARERFESDLPVSRPKTEPDIALFLPGRYLLLIEAKFTSPNGTYDRDKVGKMFDLNFDQFLRIYRDDSLKILNTEKALRQDRVHYQLWRNMMFSEYMSALDGPGTKAFHANLVRDGYEQGVCEEFIDLIHPEYQDRFEQITWEEIYQIAAKYIPDTDLLCRYLENKTEQLKPAFKLPRAQTK